MRHHKYVSLSVLLLVLTMTLTDRSVAAIPEPDNLLYGILTMDGQPLTAADSHVSVVLEFGGEEIASYTLGDDPAVQDRYLIEVPLDTVSARSDGVLRPGDAVTVSYRVGSFQRTIAEVAVAERGTVKELNLALFAADIPDGDDPDAADQDGDGIPDAAELAAGLDPFDAADGLLDSDGDGFSNLQEFLNGTNIHADEEPPQVIAPANRIVTATGLFTKVELGTAAAFDRKDGTLIPTADGDGFYAPREHRVTWSAHDLAGNRGTDTQTVRVNPMVSFRADHVVQEGSSVTLFADLNGVSARYPVTVPFTVSGTAEGEGVDHTLADGTIVIAAGLSGSIQFETVSDTNVGEGAEAVVVTMGQPTNAGPGSNKVFTVEITEEDIAPRVALEIVQDGDPSNIVAGSETVIVSAHIVDNYPGEVLSFDWSATDNRLFDNDGDPVDSAFVIDPATTPSGIYRVSVRVTDAAGNTGSANSLIRVLGEPPLLGAIDSDGDGVNDQDEGFRDPDGDGIPAYLDVIDLSNVLPAMAANGGHHLLETEPGLLLTLGAVGLDVADGDAVISVDQVRAVYTGLDTTEAFAGGLFEFRIVGLAGSGASVNIVLPQLVQIPAQALFTKLSTSELAWKEFVEDDNNALFSAAGMPGYCPPPGDAAYVAGLTPGHWCVMLRLEDGGPNDADGIANRAIEDPGGVQAVAVPQVIAPAPPAAERRSSGSGALGWLSLILLGALVGFCRKLGRE